MTGHAAAGRATPLPGVRPRCSALGRAGRGWSLNRTSTQSGRRALTRFLIPRSFELLLRSPCCCAWAPGRSVCQQTFVSSRSVHVSFFGPVSACRCACRRRRVSGTAPSPRARGGREGGAGKREAGSGKQQAPREGERKRRMPAKMDEQEAHGRGCCFLCTAAARSRPSCGCEPCPRGAPAARPSKAPQDCARSANRASDSSTRRTQPPESSQVADR